MKKARPICTKKFQKEGFKFMKGKKLLAGVLSAAMVLGTMAFPVFADDSTAIVTTTEELKTALTNSTVTEITINGTIDTQGVDFSTVDGITIKGDLSDGADILKFSGTYRTISITFSDVTLEWPNANYQGLQHSTKLTYNNCTIKGQPFLYAKDEIFNNCTFIQESSDAYNVWTYGAENVEFNNCTFKSAGKSVLVYNEGTLVSGSISVKDCAFNANASVDGKAAIEIDSQYSDYKIDIDDKTTATGFGTGSTSGSSLYNVKKYQVVTGADNSKKLNTEIKVNGETVIPLSDEKQAEEFGSCVAQIGDKYFATLADAITAAQDGDTVTLVNDVTESIKIDEGKAITFDLNGKTLTNTDGKHTIENYGALVVEDGSQNKTGKVDNITNGRASFVNYEGGVATLNGGSFDRSMENGKVGATDDGCNSYYTIKNWGIMTINENVSVNNNTDRQGGSSAIGNGYQNGANFDKHTNVTSANVILTLTGGKFTGGLNTIKNDDWAILEVNGGVFENNTQQCIMNWNKATITGGIFTGEPNAIYNGYDNDIMDKGILEITGGEFNGKIQVYDVNKKGKTSISGGTFNTDVSDYCEDGFSPKFVNGKYAVDDSADTLKLTFKKHADDERVYDIVLNGDGKDINRLNTVHFTFALDNPNMTYAIKTAKGMSTIYPDNNEYVFYYDGKDGFGDTDRPDSGSEITIGTVTFDGFGKFTFKATAGKATATTTADNLVTEFVTTGESGKGALKIIGEDDNMIKDAEIKVPTQKLTVNVAMEHNVGDNTEAYQDMTVAISGGDLAGKVLEYKLGDAANTAITKAMNGAMVASYQIKTDLTKDRIYTVTVSGAGYRTSRYTVTMTEDKTMNLWNNVMTDKTIVVDDVEAKTNFLAGDIIKDGTINIYDLSAVVAYFNADKTMDTTKYEKLAKYDLNRDGKIDMMDISIVLTSWNN